MLIGDSAHATVPFYGQGMNASFEDCRVLDELIENYSEDFSLVLREFSKSRKPNGDGLQDLSLHNFIVMRFLNSKGEWLSVAESDVRAKT